MSRKAAGRRPKANKVIVIACDGERTESDYFRNWRLVLGPTRLSVKNLTVRSGGNPLAAVRAAVKVARKDPDYHEFWCVCDVDNAPERDVVAAAQLADRHGINLCLSRRCFEIWLALHFTRTTRMVRTEDEAIGLVREHLPEYAARIKVAPFGTLLPNSTRACENAEWLEGQDCDDPATAVHKIVRTFLREAEIANLQLTVG